MCTTVDEISTDTERRSRRGLILRAIAKPLVAYLRQQHESSFPL